MFGKQLNKINVAVNIVGTTNTLQLCPESYCFYFLNSYVTDRTTKTYMVTFSNGPPPYNLLVGLFEISFDVLLCNHNRL